VTWFQRWRRPCRLGLALQGGGAHGAYTWGVLDALLERGYGAPAAISGTSAGAMNAVVLAHGLAGTGRGDKLEAAREALARFWQTLGRQLPFEWLTQGHGARTQLTPTARWWLGWMRLVAPYPNLGSDHNPLRAMLEAQIDFEALRRSPGAELYIAATRADSGRLRLFRRQELSADVLLASACLPMLQPAVLIDGEAYWDGGYSANPALFPLVRTAAVTDILLVVLSPWKHVEVPVTASQVQQRAGEISFTAAFLREMQSLADERERSRRGVWPRGDAARVAALSWHLIDGHDTLAPLSAESRLIAHWPFLEHLRDEGRERTLAWLARHATTLGRRSSIDLQHWFGGPPPGLLAAVPEALARVNPLPGSA